MERLGHGSARQSAGEPLFVHKMRRDVRIVMVGDGELASAEHFILHLL